jgi:hypothetical protein
LNEQDHGENYGRHVFRKPRTNDHEGGNLGLFWELKGELTASPKQEISEKMDFL